MNRMNQHHRWIRGTVLVTLALYLFPGVAAAEIVSGEKMLEALAGEMKNIDTAALQKQLIDQPDTVLIDVRTADEIKNLGGTIDAYQNRNIPRGWLEFRVPEAVPDKDTPIVVYCGVNLRSPLAARTLSGMGYTQVSNYADGFFTWKEAGLAVELADRARESFLYERPRKVQDGVWSAIGATAPPTYENSGHNNNLSFVITDEGVLVVNAGDNYLIARALHEEIRKLTDKPVKYVVLENGQGHAALGTSYWREQDALVIAHADAALEIETHGADILERMQGRARDKAMFTRLEMPDETFSDKKILQLGGERIELLHLGPAHSPGDIVVWLPERKLVVSGDMAFHQRMLPVFEHTDTGGWIETWGTFEALGAQTVIPGHGEPTDMAEVTRYTRDYLRWLRGEIGEVIEEGGELSDAYLIDQSAYRHLDTYDELARQNAGRVFRAMEFE